MTPNLASARVYWLGTGWRVRITVSPQSFVLAPFRRRADSRQRIALLQEHPEITGVIVWNDLAAWGVNQAAIAAGRRVPADLSIICFDQSNISNFLSFRPTVVDVRPEEMSRRAAEMLLDILAGESDGGGDPAFTRVCRGRDVRSGASKRSNAAKVRTDRRSGL